MNENFIRTILEEVIDPISQKSINKSILSIAIKEKAVFFSIECPKDKIEHYDALKTLCSQKLEDAGLKANISLTNASSTQKPKAAKYTIPGVKKVILVASGKGGVGKSTIAFNLAISLANQGKNVGIVDADIYGPSLTKLSGISNQPALENDLMIPHHKFGIKMMSVGYLVKAEDALIWRGPMTSKMLYQLIMLTNWAHDKHDLDYLIVDTPPGTGDVHLSLAEQYSIDGAIVVSTPQEMASIDAHKAMSMFTKLNVPILGVIQNYAFIEDSAGKKMFIFGKSGATARMAKEFDTSVLAEIPMMPDISETSDTGKPISYYKPKHMAYGIFMQLAQDLLTIC